MKTTLFLALSVSFVSVAHAACIEARRSLEVPGNVSVGMYHRVHPSGNYVIASGGAPDGRNNVGIWDISGTEARALPTPYVNETYPIEGRCGSSRGWEFVASPLHDDNSMHYYNFRDTIQNGAATQPVMKDRDHNDWYHSAAALPNCTHSNFRARVMLYGNDVRDIEFERDGRGAVTETRRGPRRRACTNVVDSLSSPILSKDGTEVASQSNSSTVIYRIRPNFTCEVVEDLGFYTSKVSFSYPQTGKKGKIAFVGQASIMVDGRPQPMSGVFVYDRDTKVTTRISNNQDRNPGYPGFTEDGRVIYQDQGNERIVIVDPNQLNGDGSSRANAPGCIQAGASGTSAPEPRSSTRRQ